MLICSSPRLFAAYHVLLRLLMPRHSPCALFRLTSSKLAFFAPHYLSIMLRPFRRLLLFPKSALRWRFLGALIVFCPSLQAFDFQCLAIPRTISRSPQRLNYVSKFSVCCFQLPFVHSCTRVLSEKTCFLTLPFIQFSNIVATRLFARFAFANHRLYRRLLLFPKSALRWRFSGALIVYCPSLRAFDFQLATLSGGFGFLNHLVNG